MVSAPGGGLREQKKQRTHQRLRRAALDLALEHGVEQLRVEQIASAAGVSIRTYNNYFRSREHAIAAAIVADRHARIARGAEDGGDNRPFSEVLIDAIASAYSEPTAADRAAMTLIGTSSSLRAAYLETASEPEPFVEAIQAKAGDLDVHVVRVLAACIGAAVRVALSTWLDDSPSAGTPGGLVAVRGSLSEHIVTALRPLTPMLDGTLPPRPITGCSAGG